MTLCGETEIQQLPPNLQEYVNSFNIDTDTEIDLSLPNLTEENLHLFINCLTSKFGREMENENLIKLIALKFVNEKNQEQLKAAEKAFEDGVVASLDYGMKEVLPDFGQNREPKKTHSRLNKILTGYDPVHLHIGQLEEHRRPIIQNAFKKAFDMQLENSGRYAYSFTPYYGQHPEYSFKKAINSDYLRDVVLERAKRDMKAHGMGVPINEREPIIVHNVRMSHLVYFLNYSQSKGIVEPRSGAPAVSMETYNAYKDWLWPAIQEEAYKELEEQFDVQYQDYNLEDEQERRQYFEAVYTRYYEKRIKNQNVGEIKLIPYDYAVSMHPIETFQAQLDFMAKGGFRNKLGVGVVEFIKPRNVLPGFKYQFADVLEPLAQHINNGAPLPFRRLEIKHEYHPTNQEQMDAILENTLSIAKGIADHPADYFKLASIEFKLGGTDIRNLSRALNVKKYLDFIKELNKLVDRENNPLRAEMDFELINHHFISLLEQFEFEIEQANGVENLSNERQQQYGLLKELCEQIDYYRFRVAENRRTLNYTMLINGEAGLGNSTEIQIQGPSVKYVDDVKDVRACKRLTDLDSALNGASMDQEMEDEQEQEKEQEKEKEQEANQDQNQNNENAHGDVDDNLTSLQEFKAFVHKNTIHVNNTVVEEMWRNLTGSTQDQEDRWVVGENIQAISKDAVREMLRDPDSFRNGFVDGNLPQGYHFGLLTVEGGSRKGIYFDLTEPNKNPENPLTMRVSEPLETLPRLKVSRSHFNVKAKMTRTQKMMAKMATVAMDEDPLDIPSQDEIDCYHRGELNLYHKNNPIPVDGWIVAGKMAFCTSRKNKGIVAYRAWANDPITRSISQTVLPQKVAEYVISLGGDALFDLTDRLKEVKKRCHQMRKDELFEKFFNDYVLQKDLNTWFHESDTPDFCEHMFRHEQFAGMEAMLELNNTDFEFFTKLVTQHGHHNARSDLSRLLQNFQYFKEQFNEIYPDQELPLEGLDNLIANCGDMRVAMDRILTICRNAKDNGMEYEQLATLKDCDLRSQTTYHAIEHNKFKVVLPEMNINWEYLKKGIVPKKSTITPLQSTTMYNHFVGAMPLEDCKTQFYQQFALIDDTPSLHRFKKLAQTIDQMGSPPYNNPDYIKSFLYTVSGFTLYRPSTALNVTDYLENSENLNEIKAFLQGKNNAALVRRLKQVTDGELQRTILTELNTNLQTNQNTPLNRLIETVDRLDVYPTEGLNQLAEAVDGLDIGDPESREKYARFFKGIHECQIPYVNGEKKRGAPTPQTLASYISTVQRLHENNLFSNIDPAKNAIHKCVRTSEFFDNSGALFDVIHQLSQRQGRHKVTDAQLAKALVLLESNAHVNNQAPDPENEKFALLQGGLLTAIGLIGQPDQHFVGDANDPDSLAAFIQKVKQEACGDDSLKFEALKDTLSVLSTVKWDTVIPRPTFAQMKGMLLRSMQNPQPNYAAIKTWMTSETNPGFNGMAFDLTSLSSKNVQSQGMAESFANNKAKILEALQQNFDIVDFDVGRFEDFEDCVDYIIELGIENQQTNFANANTLGYFKQTLFQGSQGGINTAKEESLSEQLKTQERQRILSMYERNYAFQEGNPNNINELKQELVRVKALQAHTRSFLGAIDSAKPILGGKFQLLLNSLDEGQFKQVPIDQMATLISNIVQDFQDNQIFNYPIISTIGEFDRLAEIGDRWDLINNILKAQIFENTKINKEQITKIMLNLAANNQLRSQDIGGLIQISEENMPVYEQLSETIINRLEAGEPVNLVQVNTTITQLLEDGLSQDQVVLFVKQPKNFDVLSELHQLQDVDKKKAIAQILARNAHTANDPQHLLELIVALNKLSVPNLNTLSTLDIDGDYPSAQNLTQSANRIDQEVNYNLDLYIEDLQREFFAKKNDPKNLNRLFNDGRVLGVINGSQSLQYAIDQSLPLQTKKKLLSDYAYIHAIGLDKPVYEGKAIKDLSKGQIKSLKAELLEIIRGDGTKEEKHLAMLKMLAVAREVYYRSTLPDGRFPYSTQMMSTLMALENGQLNINEIATGQGKSLTAALYATAMWAQGRPAIICTSNLTLAQEGMEENEHFYEYMGIPSSLIRAQSGPDTFQQQGVNYTDVSNMALFIAKNEIQGNFDVENPGLILDEADFTVLDEVTDFRYAVNLSSDNLASDVNMDEWFYYQLNAFVDKPEFLSEMVDRKSDVSNAIAHFREQLEKDIQAGRIEEPFVTHLRDRIMDFQMEGSIAQRQLDTWIDSAWNAKIIHRDGRDKAWTLEKYQHKDGNWYNAARIISHHRVSKGSKWSKGVHQFLHARINSDAPEDQLPCRIDSEKAHVAAYSSKNFVDYFIKRNGAVWGMTGTVGSPQECAELREKYGFKLARMETHQIRQATDNLPPVFASTKQGHLKAVYGLYEKHSLKKRQMPTVIVEENAKLAEDFKQGFFAKVIRNRRQYNPPPTMQFYNGIKLEIYDYANGRYQQRDIEQDFGGPFLTTEEKEDYIKKVAGSGNTVTITTPMMGRGTDFKPKMTHPDSKGKYHDHPDGLFVIQNYAEGSVREERQIKGRMGRQGKKGLYLNVVDKSRFVEKLRGTVPDVPRSIRNFNQNRLEHLMGQYKATSNNNLAKERQIKQTFGDIRGHFYEKFIGMMALSDEDRRFEEIKFMLKDTENFNESKFRKDYNAYMLHHWNRFLIDIDKKFVMLKDEHENDFEQIFPKLQEFCQQEWNKRMIAGLKHDFFNDEKIAIEADAILSDYEVFSPDQLERYAELKHMQTLLNEERQLMLSEQLLRDGIVNGVQQNPDVAKGMVLTFMPESEYSEMIDQAIENPNLINGVLLDKLEHKAEKTVSKDYNKKKRLERELQEKIDNNVLDGQAVLKVEIGKMDHLLFVQEDYQQGFDNQLYQTAINDIIAKGRQAQLQDPDQAIQRQGLTQTIVNYTKYYWAKAPNELAQHQNAKQELSKIVAIDTLNDLIQLNQLLAHDKILNIESQSPFVILDIQNPYPDDPYQAQHFLAKYINENAEVALPLLQKYFMNTCVLAHEASQQTELRSQQYNRLLTDYKLEQASFIAKFTGVQFAEQGLLNTFSEMTQQAEAQAKLNAKKATFSVLLKSNPSRAIQYRIDNNNLQSDTFDNAALVQSIKEDLNKYVNLKRVNKSRKKNAKELLEKLDGCNNLNETLNVLLEARSKAIQSDINSLGTKNKSGSRYQKLIDKAVTRGIAGTTNKGDMLVCADHLRKEMVEQMKYLKSKFNLAQDDFAPVYQDALNRLGMLNSENPQDISLKDLNNFIDTYAGICEQFRQDKARGGRSAPRTTTMTAINIMYDNILVMQDLRRKMIAEGMDMQSEQKVITDIALNRDVYQISPDYELEPSVKRETAPLNISDWPTLTVDQWNQKFAAEYQNLEEAAPTIAQILGQDVTEIKPSHMHKLVGYSKDPNLWNAYLAKAHENTILMIEKNNPRFDRRKFPPAKTLADILGDNRVPNSPTDYFKIVTAMNDFRRQLVSPNSESERLQLFSLTGQLQLPLSMLGEKARNYRENAIGSFDEWGPPITEEKVETLYEDLADIDKDITESQDWQQYWLQNEEQIKRAAKSALIKQKQNEFIRQHRQDHPEDKNLPRNMILNDFDQSNYPDIQNFDGNQFVDNLKQQILASYRYKVITNTSYVADQQDEEFALKTTRRIDFVQRISAKMRKGKSANEAFTELKEEFKQALTNEVETSIQHHENLLKKGTSLENVTRIMQQSIERVKAKNYNIYLGHNVNDNDIINPLLQQKQKFDALQNLITRELEGITQSFVPSEQNAGNTRVLELIKHSVDTILNSQEYQNMGPLGMDALRAHLSSKESIDKVYKQALDARTEHFKQKIITHYQNRQPGDINWLLDSAENGVKWIKHPRARRELIANLYNEIKDDNAVFSSNIHGNNRAKRYRKALAKDLLEAYKLTIEEDLKSMPKEHAKGLLQRLKTDPLLKLAAGRGRNPHVALLNQWNKMVDERPDQVLEEDQGLMLDVNLGLWKELENVINRSEKDQLAVEMLKAERDLYALPQSNDIDMSIDDMVAVLDDKNSYDRIKENILSIVDLDERIIKIEELFSEAKQNEHYQMSNRYGLFGGDKVSKNQKQIIGILQDLYVDTVERLALKEAHIATEVKSEKWSDKLPERLSSETADKIMSELLNPALKSYVLNTGLSDIKERQLKNQITQLITEVHQREQQPVEPQVDNQNRMGGGQM